MACVRMVWFTDFKGLLVKQLSASGASADPAFSPMSWGHAPEFTNTWRHTLLFLIWLEAMSNVSMNLDVN